jgi:predicted  nucleic acid-binding Zn-ribbon protein
MSSQDKLATADSITDPVALDEIQQDILERALVSLEDLGVNSQRIHNVMLKLSQKNKDQKKYISELEARNMDLESRIRELEGDLSDLDRVKQRLIEDLDQTISILTKRRRLVSDTMSSPRSPTYGQEDQ